ncbi:S8 family peptidase [Candidatus Desantisbacteria bacterium]|nr:S8 family peptidase [Candidatus Desantisbacteria bacterium]
MIPTKEKYWCEVWLSSDREELIQRFESLLDREKIEKTEGVIRFPERTVKLILANRSQLERLIILSDDIAEYRRAKETSAFWLNMENKEQVKWVKDILQRCKVEPNPKVAVCVLDTGINNGHPLLSLILKSEDCQTVNPSWGINDHDKYGHGTLMAGLAAYGDLRECLSSTDSIYLNHCLESIKILPPPPEQNKIELWGDVTGQAVSRAEIQSPERKRILCMAIAASDTRDRGRPSSWSGKLDQLSSGADDDNKRLFIVCAGNSDPSTWRNYPYGLLTDSVHDPAQSWNVLTVGAYTELEQIKDKSFEGYTIIAPSGGLSPFSTTSLEWDPRWPIKPEIVMEGGNVAYDRKDICDGTDDISLLSTSHDPTTHHFCNFNMTSAATAQAAWFAAQIHNVYPDIWPETIRNF